MAWRNRHGETFKKIQPNMSPDEYMRLAIAMAQKVPGYPFGAIIVPRSNGDVLGKGYNRSSRNPIVHGEIDVINRCAAKHAPVDWANLDLYSTAEPCPVCQSAIEWAGMATVYFGTSIPFLQEHGWRQIDIRAAEVARRTAFRNTKVIGGVLEQECNALFWAAQRDDI